MPMILLSEEEDLICQFKQKDPTYQEEKNKE